MTREIFHRIVLDEAERLNINCSKESILSAIDKLFIISDNGTIVPYNQNKPIVIYCLINPVDNSIFYIGRTSEALSKRLYFHIIDSNRCNQRKYSIIKSIKDAGKSVLIRKLEEFKPICESEYNGTHKRESFWINKCLLEGYNLTNRIQNNT